MVRVRIDLAIFYSPTEAFGSIFGELDIDRVPESGSVFPWPTAWMDAKPAYFADDNQSRIWSVNPWEHTSAECLVTMYGFVCESISDARDCANFLVKAGDFELLEY